MTRRSPSRFAPTTDRADLGSNQERRTIMTKVTKIILASAAVVVGLMGLVISNINLRSKGGPDGASVASTEQQQEASASDFPNCDDDNTKQSVGTTLASSGTQLLDIGNIKELNFDSTNHIRYCEADI